MTEKLYLKMPKTLTDKLLTRIEKKGIVRASELSKMGIPRKYLTVLENEGKIIKLSRGLYASANAPINDKYMLAQACKRLPGGIICLLSALQFHRMGTQSPIEVWIAIKSKSHRPKLEYPPIRLCEFAGQSYSSGVEHFFYEGSEIRIYSPAKTIADCFKFRNRIGLDLAIDALKDYFRRPYSSVDELLLQAEICKVKRIILPYIEAIK